MATTQQAGRSQPQAPINPVNFLQPQAPAASLPRKTEPMARSVKSPMEARTKMTITDPSVAPTRAPETSVVDTVADVPAEWGMKVLDKPHSYVDGDTLKVMVVAKTMAVFTQGYAGQAAYRAAHRFGIVGRPALVSDNTRIYPVDENYNILDKPVKDCLWAKYITIVSR